MQPNTYASLMTRFDQFGVAKEHREDIEGCLDRLTNDEKGDSCSLRKALDRCCNTHAFLMACAIPASIVVLMGETIAELSNVIARTAIIEYQEVLNEQSKGQG